MRVYNFKVRHGDGSAPDAMKNLKLQSGKFISMLVILLTAFIGAEAQSLDQLSSQLNSKKTEERRNALQKLREIGTPEAGRLAIAALSDKEAVVRATAASVVILLRSSEAVTALARNLDDKSEFVRKETAYALGKTGSGEAVAPISERFGSESDLEVRASLAIALGDIGNPAGVAALTAILRDAPKEDDEFLRRSAARSIGRIAQNSRTGTRDETSPVSFLSDKYKDDLSGLPPADLAYFKTAGDILLKVVQNKAESSDTRREAAYALGAIGDPSFKDVLLTLARSDDSYLAEIAREALKRLSAVVK